MRIHIYICMHVIIYVCMYTFMHIYIYIYYPGPANEQKKNVVLVNDLVFSQLTYFGSDRAIQPKRPKMAEIWLKSNFLCVSMVSQSHNFTFFHHSYTCSTD